MLINYFSRAKLYCGIHLNCSLRSRWKMKLFHQHVIHFFVSPSKTMVRSSYGEIHCCTQLLIVLVVCSKAISVEILHRDHHIAWRMRLLQIDAFCILISEAQTGVELKEFNDGICSFCIRESTLLTIVASVKVRRLFSAPKGGDIMQLAWMCFFWLILSAMT